MYDTDNSCHSLFSNHPSVVEKNRLAEEERKKNQDAAAERAERKRKKKEELERIMIITKFEARRKRMMIKGHDGSSSDEKEGKPKQSLAM
jgi:hypothetical protein